MKNWDAIKETDAIYYTKEASKALSRYSIVTTPLKILEMWKKLRLGQKAVMVILNSVKWVNPQIVIVLSAIDFFQSMASLG
ncbi:hypothetical protein [Mesomycoplasma ovipneumoniae]|uniref:hypothetical protein n=1 Tax=Mesomycoplasma ovipneumoniae TaxID=29562 RepID=UPI0029649BFD|nr:hypothetical protein [Mesomycoplasma ovipneumoniae]MDW2906998.1 hypothetical protein [Mesomycoplasma ovipneumoniae]MDW2909134.1 hypothetical protein [Mesomycoplasma ovipneumoniae]MDW2919782.1 hypothetical protein [Mesomycoplasma ovipneumoniae]MDW2920644.1 hypothetical protein [Mesomycoplasma ovipneumoniae]MDW2921488.1 hypothetical protein [Mesomycoplasma ovipneumoniae]